MKLNFQIDKNYLIAHTVSQMEIEKFSSNKYKKDIVDFQNYAWKKSKIYYAFLSSKPEFHLKKLNEKDIKKFVSGLFKYIENLKKSREFKKIYKQTETYKEKCKNEWNKNYKQTYKLIKELTGFNLNKTFTVYITHPSQRNGRYIGDNKILWGTTGKWKNYNTIYLWHEILHSYFDFSQKTHAIIELITDEEMRHQLNGTKYPPFVGHKELILIKKKLLPRWKKYLKQEKKNIKKLL